MLNRTWWSPFPYQNEKVMWLFIHKCFDFILIWARSFLKQLQHNINDNIVFQAFINTTTLLKCPDFPSIYNRYTTICLKTLDISRYRYIDISIYRYIDISIYRYIDISIYQYIDISIYRYIDIAIYRGFLGISLYICCISKGSLGILTMLLYWWKLEILYYRWCCVVIVSRNFSLKLV